MTPGQVKLLVRLGIIVAIAAAGAAGGWTLNGWRLGSQIAQLKGELQHERDQLAVLAGGLEACNAGVSAAAKAGDDVLKLAGKLLDAARRVHAGATSTADRLEDLLKQPPPKDADCNQAWDLIEADRKARTP